MSPKKSVHQSPKYPHLFKYPKRSRFLVYRRFHVARGKHFSFSTGEEKNEKVANDIGEKAYHEWLLKMGDAPKVTERRGPILFVEYAQAHLDRKLARPDHDFSKGSKAMSDLSTRHLIAEFGHLGIEQVDEEKWEDYCNRLSSTGKPPKFFNRHKELREILGRAHRSGMIKRLPEFRNPDGKTDAGRFLEDWEVLAIQAEAAPDTALLIEIMWKQGARPDEALQYEWTMINWKLGKYGSIAIPGRITKTRRSRSIPLQKDVAAALRSRQKQSESIYVFPSPEAYKGGEFRMVEYKTGWEGALARAQKSAKAKGRKIVHAVPYDMRRTFITNCAARGKPILWVAKYCDTSVAMIERFYAKVQQSTLQEILE